MSESITDITNNGKIFELVIKDSIVPVTIFELTIKQLEEVVQIFVETLKSEQRKEAISMSECLPEKERMKYLVQAARENATVDPKAITELWDKEFAAVTCLKIASKKPDVDWAQVLFDNPEMCLSAYLFALGQKDSEVKTEDGKKN